MSHVKCSDAIVIDAWRIRQDTFLETTFSDLLTLMITGEYLML